MEDRPSVPLPAVRSGASLAGNQIRVRDEGNTNSGGMTPTIRNGRPSSMTSARPISCPANPVSHRSWLTIATSRAGSGNTESAAAGAAWSAAVKSRPASGATPRVSSIPGDTSAAPTYAAVEPDSRTYARGAQVPIHSNASESRRSVSTSDGNRLSPRPPAGAEAPGGDSRETFTTFAGSRKTSGRTIAASQTASTASAAPTDTASVRYTPAVFQGATPRDRSAAMTAARVRITVAASTRRGRPDDLPECGPNGGGCRRKRQTLGGGSARCYS